MATTLPPAPIVKKKSGLGCFGCGCLILVLLALLVLGLFGAGSYYGYRWALAFTSPTASVVPTFDGGEDAYNKARQKLNDFNHNLQNHLASTIHLNSDELNTLIARSPDFDHTKVHFFVAMTGSQARVQASLPTEIWTKRLFKDRYVNLDTTFGLSFDASTHLLLFQPQDLKVADTVRYDSANADDATTRQVTSMLPVFDQQITDAIRQSPDGKELINHAKSIEIKDSELVIETQ